MDRVFKTCLVLMGLLFAQGCHPVGGPDKTFTGAVLGAGWGAGAGAIIGNQLDSTGQGAAIGAGFGAVSGTLVGMGLDAAEETEIERQREVDALKVEVAANQRSLASLQRSLDERDRKLEYKPRGAKILFGEGDSELRSGSYGELERLSKALQLNPYVGLVEVHGHADDLGPEAKNFDLSERRARTVADFLKAHGVSQHKIRVIAHGAQEPVASNKSETGRQLNRRVEVVLLK